MDQYLNTIISYIETFSSDNAGLWHIITEAVRYLVPVLSAAVLWRCAVPLLTFRRQPEQWAWFIADGTQRFPVTHWESMIGSSTNNDIILAGDDVYRSHAVLTRYDDGSWSVSDVGSQGGLFRNDGKERSVIAVNYGDEFFLGHISCMIEPLSEEERTEQNRRRIRPGKRYSAPVTLLMLSTLQVLFYIGLFSSLEEAGTEVLRGFTAMLLLEWALWLFLRFFRSTGFELETIAFLLCSYGFALIGSIAAGQIMKEFWAMLLGVLLYLVLGISLSSLDRAKKLRYWAAAAGLLLFAVNILIGTVQNGARNWIVIGGLSIQPSELVKLCFLFVAASTLDRVVARRNLILFIVYSGIVCACLAYISDFGSALVFFSAFLVAAFLRSGSFAGIALICTAVSYAVTIVLRFRPYILERFQAWGRVWDYANVSGGYQQTRSMMCIASGGLFGLGGGNGFLKYVAASSTDLVFASVAEEWGLIASILMVLAVAVLAMFAVRSAYVARSTFYMIGSCTGAAFYVTQTILNMFGTVDFLPLTGVTFPFVSNGGSSMLACWGILAFLMASDTRQNASFAVKIQKEEGI